jgi:hypothetical protein
MSEIEHKNILYLTTYAPFGTSTGHQKVSSSFLAFLCKFSTVDLISFRPINDSFPIKKSITNGRFFLIKQIHLFAITKIFKIAIGFISGKSFQESIYYSKDLASLLLTLDPKKYDLAIVETYWLYIILKSIMPNINIILAAHSAESVYLASRLRQLKIPTFLTNLLLSRVTKIESYLFENNRVISMGSVPAMIFKNKYSVNFRPNIFTTNLGTYSPINSINTKKQKILSIIGNHYYHPNAQGLEFFSSKLLCKFLNDDWTVRIIGKVPSYLVRHLLKNSNKNPRLHILGYVEDLDKHLNDSPFVFCTTTSFSGDLIKVWTAIEKNKIVIVPRDYFNHNIELHMFKDQIILFENFDDYKSIQKNILDTMHIINLSYNFDDSKNNYVKYASTENRKLQLFIEGLCTLNEPLFASA